MGNKALSVETTEKQTLCCLLVTAEDVTSHTLLPQEVLWSWTASTIIPNRGIPSSVSSQEELSPHCSPTNTCAGSNHLCPNHMAQQVILVQARSTLGYFHGFILPQGPGVDHLCLRVGICRGGRRTRSVLLPALKYTKISL